MADEYGLPGPDDPEDYQNFMLDLYDMIQTATLIGVPEEGIALLRQARARFIEDFQRKHPGYGKGRAVW